MASTVARVDSVAVVSVSGADPRGSDDVVGAVAVELELLLEQDDDMEDEDKVQLVDVIELAGVEPEVELAIGIGESSSLSLCSSILRIVFVAAGMKNETMYWKCFKNKCDWRVITV